MTKKSGKIAQLSVAALLLLASSAAHAQKEAKGARGEKAMPKLAAGSSYIACYFGDASNSQWHWALAPNNGWYSVAGDYNKSQFTKIERFVTSTSQNDIVDACARSKAYYKITGNLFAAFAATRAAGYNYPILSNGTILYPQY
jgi:hypothetical protein